MINPLLNSLFIKKISFRLSSLRWQGRQESNPRQRFWIEKFKLFSSASFIVTTNAILFTEGFT